MDYMLTKARYARSSLLGPSSPCIICGMIFAKCPHDSHEVRTILKRLRALTPMQVAALPDIAPDSRVSETSSSFTVKKIQSHLAGKHGGCINVAIDHTHVDYEVTFKGVGVTFKKAYMNAPHLLHPAPDFLCGSLSTTESHTGVCVLLKNHEGKHSWEK